MKASFKFFLATLAATAVLAGCAKEITPPSFEKDKVNPEGARIIAVSFTPQTKTTLDGFQPRFVDNDSILISNGVAIDTCDVEVEGNVATISTNLTGPLTAVYPYKAAKMNDNNHNLIDTVLVSTVQDGTFASANICMARMTDENEESLSFENKTAVFCIYPPTDNPEYVEVSAEGFNIANDYPEGSTYTTCNTIHVAPITTDSVYVSILVPDGLKIGDLKFSDGTNEKTVTGEKAATAIAAGTLYTVTATEWKSPEADTPEGALKGVFTVDASGKKVHFSKGNLRYVVNTQEWGFYEQQYDFCNTSEYNGRHSETVSLFTWGYNAEKSIVPNGNEFDNVSRISDNFEQAEDWGCTIGDCNTWRTLTTSEWSYLFYSRSHTNDLYKYGVTVCGSENCVVLLPDNWAWDANTVGTGWQNDYPATSDDKVTWQTMEEAGAVCLPAAGYRNGSSVDNIGGNGCYWSSTAYDSYSAYFVDFYSNLVSLGADGGWRLYGFSVRLVTDVSAAPTPTEPDYVEITAKYDGEDNPARTLKWATKNLANTDSGKKSWKGGNESAVKVPGTNEDVIVGDYFQWAASYAGYNITSNPQEKDLLLYTSFENKKCGDANDKFYTDGGNFSKSFNKSNAPYGGTSYSKYNSSSPAILERTTTANDDVANIILGDNWRMPTTVEFQEMRKVTYWAWDATDCGYYVFKPGEGTSGAANGREDFNTSTDDKSKALLFFPAAGYGDGTNLYDAGSRGDYWSSSLRTGDTDYAYDLLFNSDGVYPLYDLNRFGGFSVRPVSDK